MSDTQILFRNTTIVLFLPTQSNTEKVSDSIIVIPTYNEKENIERMIRTILHLPKQFHILIVDDNSPDGTAGIVKKIQKRHPDQLFMVERKGKLGLGTAYLTGFRWALENDYRFIFEMDADFSHNPEKIPIFLQHIKEGRSLIFK